MKYIFSSLVMILIFSACQKEYQSPEEQLVQAIEEKANSGDQPLNVMVLKTDKLCSKIDCTTEVIESDNTTLTVYNREDIFMHNPSIYFKLAQWTDAPQVIAVGQRGEILTKEEVEHKCRGN